MNINLYKGNLETLYMFWDKKEKDKGLPDLPPLKTPMQPPTPMPSSETHAEDEDDNAPVEKHGLPSFPDSPIQKGFSQAAIKDAVSNESVEDHQEDPEESVNAPRNEQSFKTVEVEEWSPQQQSIPSMAAPPTSPPKSSRVPSPSLAPPPRTPFPPSSMAPQQRPEKNGDIFVKIDKFYSAKRALEAAALKINEIDALLQKIRETKMREEQELTGWEKDIATIKARIKDVTDTIFEKVE